MILRISNFRLSGMAEMDDGRRESMSVRIPSLEMRAGGITAVIGGSGCGKSVLLSLLMGHPPFGIGGELECNRFELFGAAMPEGAFRSTTAAVRWRRQMWVAGGLFYLPQAFPVAKTLRTEVASAMIQIVQAMAFPCRLSQRKAEMAVEKAFKAHDLAPVLEKSLCSLSGGERRRAELLARLVAMKAARRPALLVLDEPTTGFDPANALLFIRDVRAVIDELHGEGVPAAALLSTHEMKSLDDRLDDGRRIVDRACVVQRDLDGPGKGDCTVLYDGTVDGVWQRFLPQDAGEKRFSSHGEALFEALTERTTAEWLADAGKPRR